MSTRTVNPTQWTEIPVTDLQKGMDFYSAVFGWSLSIDDTGPNPEPVPIASSRSIRRDASTMKQQRNPQVAGHAKRKRSGFGGAIISYCRKTYRGSWASAWQVRPYCGLIFCTGAHSVP